MKKKDKLTLTEKTMVLNGKFPADPMGSYTGTPADIYDVPVQDADDL